MPWPFGSLGSFGSFIFAAFSATSGSKDRGRTDRTEREWMLCMTDSTETSRARARNEAGQADFYIFPNRRIIAKCLTASEFQAILQKLAPGCFLRSGPSVCSSGDLVHQRIRSTLPQVFQASSGFKFGCHCAQAGVDLGRLGSLNIRTTYKTLQYIAM